LNFLHVKKSRRNRRMPVYQYKVMNEKKLEEFFEIEQKISDPPLQRHPLTLEPVKRILTTASLSLNHSTQHEKKSLSSDNLNKNGFTQYEKDSSSGDYFRTVGDQGPGRISSDQIQKSGD
jgi:predicted nucleic acid-binding Zn ribbon protein